MKKILSVAASLILFACTISQKPATISSAYDHLGDIKLFLSTTEQKEEDEVIERLKSNDVDSSQIKLVLQTMVSTPNRKLTGLQPNLKFKMNGNHKCLVCSGESIKKPILFIVLQQHSDRGVIHRPLLGTQNHIKFT